MTDLQIPRPREVFDYREILRALRAFKRGDFSVRMPGDLTGIDGEIAESFNDIVRMNEAMTAEFARIRDQVGKDGKINQRARMLAASGSWVDCVDSVNTLIRDLVRPTSEVARVMDAVAKGDLSQTMVLEIDGRPLRGEFFRIGTIVNTMVDQLNAFASEVSRVAREVGTDGKLGGQAQVPGVAGTWKDLTDNVNLMAANLTGQVRGIANIVTAVAYGDLDHKVVFEAKGEIAALADTINGMIDTLATFADQVTNVAREVGVEGKLGGQAKVPGAAGLWRGLTDNVNQLAANLTTQVRAIAEVATAVAQGDLTRSIMVNAQGEVAALKDNINEMIRNLAGTTRKNTDQDWLKTNLANFSRTLQGHRGLVAVSKLILSELAPLVDAQQGVVYAQNVENDEPRLDLLATYACKAGKKLPRTLRFHENLIGQCAFEKKRILLNDMPADYIPLRSALGSAAPLSVIIMPVLFEGEVKAVIELASFKQFSEAHLTFLEQLTESIGIVFNTIEATMRTEHLLTQSQSLTSELQRKQEELQRTNQRLQENATQLSEQMKQVEYKNKEVELAKAALEEKAAQLALSSQYKSEFLANMSHELRTPLNSLLILAQLLAESPASNLTPKQIEYAQTIYAAGNDLLALINDILDLAKVESGTVILNIATERLAELRDYVDRAFRQVGRDKGLEFRISMERNLPPAIRTDTKRLRQILKNLLSNAFKFTAKGAVSLQVAMVTSGWTPGHPVLDEAEKVVAFSVIDTGIGIAPDKQQIIFEAFQQADGTTSRHFGGTGLGLSISSELTRLLGGEIKVQSSPGKGSTFTLYLPVVQKAEGDNSQREGIVNKAVATEQLQVNTISNDRQARELPDDAEIDGMMIGQSLADRSPIELVRGLAQTGRARRVPIAIHIAESIDASEQNGFVEPAELPVLKRGPSAQPVLKEPTLFLQNASRDVLPIQPRPPSSNVKVIPELAGRKVLLVDDDIRNLFALTSVLEQQGMIVMNAENGLDVIERLKNNPEFDIILMDMMMPELDGYDTIRVVRGHERFRGVPIIGVSAKAMQGDREKCIEAGASDYIAKPVNVDHLLSLVRTWLVH
jgi:signal transduction histidine kinase/CheY-like chemotaxis protein/HAMP domain-containing protein